MAPSARGAAAAFGEAFPTTEVPRPEPGGRRGGAAGTAAAADVDAGAAGVDAGGDAGAEASGAPPVEAGASGGAGVTLRDALKGFEEALAARQLGPAAAAMRKHVEDCVERGIGARAYSRAATDVLAMRAMCVAAHWPDPFNAGLRELSQRYRSDAAHGGFWAHLMSTGARLIGSAEAVGSDISSLDVAPIGGNTPGGGIAGDVGGTQASGAGAPALSSGEAAAGCPSPPAAAAIEDDDLEDMD
eukprot:366239-Chlamydomonas_euryale.AAC.41